LFQLLIFRFEGLSQVLGSLTLGGYDTSKFIPNDFSVPFAPNVDKDLTIQIDSISTDKGESLLSSPIMAFLDSTIPYIYLPTSACTLFENAFGLVWNDTAQLYLVNTTQHTLLQTQNPSVTFTIGSNYTNSKVNITLPYAAFDLTASYPLVDGASRYFPLQRANDSTQYTLGRTFFQEAYVIADFERKSFSVSQCKWVQAPQNIMAILPPSNSTLGPSLQHKSLSKGGIAGIAVAAALICLGAILGWLFWRKSRRRKIEPVQPAASSTRPETQEYRKPELESIPATSAVFETHDARKIDGRAEIGTHNEIHEMPAREEVAAEMVGSTSASEIGGREQRWSWVRGDSRASRFRFGSSSGTRSPMSPESPRDPGEDTMSSLSSGYGTLVDHIVSPQVASPGSPFPSAGESTS
jgi:Eukaryotic aspartyl protease